MKKKETPLIKIYLKVMVLAAVGILIYLKCISAQVIHISDEVYVNHERSYFRKLFTDDTKKVIWLGAKCAKSLARKEDIDSIVDEAQFFGYYIHRPYLQTSLLIEPHDKLGLLIMQSCAETICIVIPTKQMLVRTSEEYLERDLIKYKEW